MAATPRNERDEVARDPRGHLRPGPHRAPARGMGGTGRRGAAGARRRAATPSAAGREGSGTRRDAARRAGGTGLPEPGSARTRTRGTLVHLRHAGLAARADRRTAAADPAG